MYVQIVRFKTSMTEQELLKKAKARSDRCRATDGLLQKYYLSYPDTDEFGAVYIWESEEAMKNFRRTGLAGSLPEAYQMKAAPNITQAEVKMTLYPEVSATRKALTIGRR